MVSESRSGGQSSLTQLCYVCFTFLPQLIDNAGLETQKGAFSVASQQLCQGAFVRERIWECVS